MLKASHQRCSNFLLSSVLHELEELGMGDRDDFRRFWISQLGLLNTLNILMLSVSCGLQC